MVLCAGRFVLSLCHHFFIAILTAVRLWILYCQFMMDIMEGEDSLQGVRSTFEKAIIAAGLHVTEVFWLINVFYLLALWHKV